MVMEKLSQDVKMCDVRDVGTAHCYLVLCVVGQPVTSTKLAGQKPSDVLLHVCYV